MRTLTDKQKIGCIVAPLQFLIVAPIWYYLLYRILGAVGATNVMWLLFWIYVPVAAVTTVVWKIAEVLAEE